MREKYKDNEKGQALLLVIVALTVALAVGVSTSLRTLSTVSRTATTDTAVRVLAAAEGGIESLLSYSTKELEDAIGLCNTLDYGSANPDCVIDFPTSGDDVIASRAVVMVEELSLNQNKLYRTNILGGRSFSIHLGDYEGDLQFCWKDESDMHIVLADGTDISNWDKNIICGSAGCVTSPIDGAEPPSGCGISELSGMGYSGGHTYDVLPGGNSKVLTFIPINDHVELVIKPLDGDVGKIGYLITSKGQLVQEGREEITKVVTARRSLPYLPAGFYFGIFSDQGITTNN